MYQSKIRDIQRTVLFLLIVQFLSFISLPSWGFDIQQINTVTNRNGLSQNTVRTLMQDSQGFLWMGTINGVNRFDGKEFLTIKPGTGLSSSIADNRIINLFEDRNGFIWILTYSNTVFCYDTKAESFVDYATETDSKLFNQITETANGDIWLWGKYGCARIRHIDGKLQSQSFSDTRLHQQPISFLFEDEKHGVWIGLEKELLRIVGHSITSVEKGTTYKSVHEIADRLFFVSETGVAVFDDRDQAFLSTTNIVTDQAEALTSSCIIDNSILLIIGRRGMHAFDTRTLKPISAHSFFRGTTPVDGTFITDNKGGIWAYNRTGTLWRHRPGNTFDTLNLISPTILSLVYNERFTIYNDSRGIIWITTYGNGLFAIDTSDETIHHYTADKDLTSNYLFCVTEDKSGEIWVGTEFAGAIKISLAHYPVSVLNVSDDRSNRGNAVRLIYKDTNRRYWFGTRGGHLFVCDSLFNSLHDYHLNGGIPFSMAEDTLGCKWVGTKGEGLFIFPPQGIGKPQNVHLHSHAGQSSLSDNVFTVLKDSKNRMWISTFGGGLHLGERKGSQLTFTQINMANEQQDMMRSMIQDRNGFIWVGSNEGAIVFDPDELILDKTRYMNFRSDTKNPQSLSSDEVKVIFEDSKGNIWLGTTGGGLNLLVRESSLKESWFKHYTSKDGLSNEIIQAIREDDAGYLWVSTENDISRFNPTTERFENIIFSESKQPALFCELASWKKDDGELMFGSYNGIYIFNPSEITYNTYVPPVTITDLRVNGNKVKPGEELSPLNESITTTSKIILSHNQNSFSLEFSVLDFHAPEYNQYTYYLEGYENNWNNISRSSVAAYRNVPPGTYTFRVKGTNGFGVWSAQETVVEIIVKTPWWKSAWAFSLYAIIIAVIAFFVSRMLLKIHRLNTAVEVEKQLTEYKLRFFTNISHEFRTPLTIIRGSIDALSGYNNLPWFVDKQLNALSKSSSRLLRLIDQLLEFRKLQNNKMELRLEKTDVVSFFYDIYQTFNEMAERKNIEYRFISEEKKWRMLIDKNKMDKVAYNLLSNAFKHTPSGGKIDMSLNFSTADGTFILRIADNGAGVPKEQRDNLFTRFHQVNYTSNGIGVGLHLTSELTKVHKGSIRYTESEWGGACFEVSIPLSENVYSPVDIIETIAYTPENVATTHLIKDAKTFDSPIGKPYKEYDVMVVEDDDEVRDYIVGQLSEYFTVLSVANGAEALAVIAEKQPDIVVSDVMMPEIDGFKLTKRIKDGAETSHIPVILLTAYSSEQHQLEGVKMGADDYVTKPFSIEYLVIRIVKLIEQRKMLQQKFMTEPGVKPQTTNFTDRDKAFLNKLHSVIENNVDNADFTVEEFAQALSMARTNFYKKVKGLTGHSPNEYLRIIRMKKAAELLLTTDLNVGEISYQVGINDQFHFSKMFKAQFGVSPLQYRKK
ncbi:hybrid sensor histidine kinase/response regulator transcription factor [uncultured Bacteroides sp.]|uniref:hybrid sensor histidine kinase/response regulator transcription factor n=1 Tax=uncultured Bacteroides sp. TaxID=162156 RepID=UPI0025E89A20|nr:hybrid sensor histidine kinase/response regulator transcription factor [uncultured Bacteroides sp.]